MDLTIAPISKDQVAALGRLMMSSDFHKFLEFVQFALDSQDQENRTLEGIRLHWGQGASQTLDGLLNVVNSQKEVAQRMRKSTEQGASAYPSP